MDTHLLKLSVDYHGPSLIDWLSREQPTVDLPHTRRSLANLRHGWALSEDAFQQKLAQLIARKADLLFAVDTRGQHQYAQHHVEDNKCCAVVAPLESCMQILSSDRRLHCLKCLEKGDIVLGVVSAVQDTGLLITLFCLDGGKVRDIDELNLTAFCPVSELPRYYAHEGPLEAFTIKDRVRGVVLNVVPAQENVVVSLKSSPSSGDHGHVKLGLVDDDDVPLHHRCIGDVAEGSYPRQLKASSGFNNPRSVEYLSDLFGLRVHPMPSLMRGLRGVTYPESDYKEPLRKAQSRRLALKSVSEGVSHFKAGRHIEAMQYLNKALQIDEENVDALVARGALYANNESYSRAIGDFTEALKLNPHHRNARKYTCETLVAQAKGLADQSKEEEAVSCLEQALELEPHMEEARVTLHRLQNLLSRQGGRNAAEAVVVSDGESESEDDQEEKAEIKRVSATLRKLIEQDKMTSKHRTRRSSGSETNHSRKDRRSSGSKKRKKKKRHSHDDSSDDDRPAKRRRHSRPSDTESEKSRRRHRSSSVEIEKSPVSSHSREEENRPSRKSRRSSAGNGKTDCVEVAPLSTLKRLSSGGEKLSSGRRDSLDSHGRRESQEHRTHSRERVIVHSMERVNDGGCEKTGDPEPRDKSMERKRQSSEHSRCGVTMTTDVRGSGLGGSGMAGRGVGSSRESLDEMENFLKALKERKKQMEGRTTAK